MKPHRISCAAAVALLTASLFGVVPRATAQVPGYETGVIGEIVKAWPTGVGGWSDECRILNRHDGGYDIACNRSGEYFVPYRWVARMNGPTAAAPPAARPPAPTPAEVDEPDPVIPQLTKGTYRCYDEDDTYVRQNVVITSKTAYKDRRGKSGRYRQTDDLLTFTSGPYKGWDASVDEDGTITLTDPKTDVTTSCRKG